VIIESLSELWSSEASASSATSGRVRRDDVHGEVKVAMLRF
jgi:hypothetical protein